MKARVQRLAAIGRVKPDEQRLAGVVSGLLFVLGAVTLPLLLILPGVTHSHPAATLTIAAAAGVWGITAGLVIDWTRAPDWLLPVTAVFALALTALAIAATGGATSPAWIYLLFVAVFASYFFRRPMAVACLAACVAIHASPIFYDSRSIHDEFIAQFVIAGTAYLVLGGAIIAGKRLMWELQARAEQLAAEQVSLRRVATAVVGGDPTERIYELVAREAAALLGGEAAGILRLENAHEATVMGSWAGRNGGRYQPGTTVNVRAGGEIERALLTNKPVRLDRRLRDSPVERLGYRSGIIAPIHVAGRIWGVMSVTAARAGQLTVEDEERLMEFGDLLATAIASIEDRAKLTAQAASDPLTGLANHRTLQQRLNSEVARAIRHDSVLSVAVLDIDHFKQINDSSGHDVGDEMLVRVARCLTKLARSEDTLGRVGGDEFAWILPDTTREQALVAIERARRVIADASPHPFQLTVSAGICDTSASRDPAELIRLADGALYWSKAHGRNQCWIYDPAVIAELSAQERAERLQRSQGLLGLRALARAIDAKDPATREHSERVATLARKLAWTAGWTPERALLLSEAALVHDVGKIGMPDALLRKTEPLTPEERALLADHAGLSARIVEGVLRPEQVEWIRNHHERPDGEGYPDGLTHAEISEGAALLAIADAWDVMTISRPYSSPKSVEQALEECFELNGIQFMPAAVAALLELHAAGELAREDTSHRTFVSP